MPNSNAFPLKYCWSQLIAFSAPDHWTLDLHQSPQTRTSPSSGKISLPLLLICRGPVIINVNGTAQWLQNALPSFQMNEKGELITIDGIFMGAKTLTNFAIHCLGKKVIADLSEIILQNKVSINVIIYRTSRKRKCLFRAIRVNICWLV